MSAWDTRKEELKEEMESSLAEFSIDEVRTEGMTVRIGGKVVKLQVTEEVTLPEDDIRAEYSAKLTEKLQRIKGVLNEKFSEMTYMVEQYKSDFEEKERALQRRLSEANLMPDLTYEHAKAGLSIVKGGDQGAGGDALVWLYQGVYWPKYLDGNPIDPKYAKRMISPVTIKIVTNGNRVSEVTVRKTIGLEKFDHYHRLNSGDCWGDWKFERSWNTPDDILAIARRSLAVLENVNSHSPGNQNPAGLPRLSTLQSHVLRGEEARRVQHTLSRAEERAGITTQTDRGESSDVWST